MQLYKILILTDHRNHSKENSLYAIVRVLSRHPGCAMLDVATRNNAANDDFFNGEKEVAISAVSGRGDFEFNQDGSAYSKNIKSVVVKNYDAVWLRLPPPIPASFLRFLYQTYPQTVFINDPMGMLETGSKAFLMNFTAVCPPMCICLSVADIRGFAAKFPKFVLKPFREYGGKGIVKVDRNIVETNGETMTLDDFLHLLSTGDVQYLAVKFLENVSKGDKRVVVVNGKIIGASLRLPAEGTWLCNVAAGGQSVPTQVTPTERAIVHHIHPRLAKMGVVMYGVDLLTGDDGQPVLSEINTTSIGGIPQMALQQKRPLVEETVNEIILAIGRQRLAKT